MSNFDKSDLDQLDLYINEHIGTTTTRHASEDRFECPPTLEAVSAERIMRRTLHTMFDSYIKLDSNSTPSLEDVKYHYWQKARMVDTEHGAKENFLLDDYFAVEQDRYYELIRDSILNTYEPESIPAMLCDAIEIYIQSLSIESIYASRILLTLLKRNIMRISVESYLLEQGGMSPEASSRQAIRTFVSQKVPEHITYIKSKESSTLYDIGAQINKGSFYPEVYPTGASEARLYICESDAKGFTKISRIQERPYTPKELQVANELYKNPTLQKAVLLFHLSLVAHATSYLKEHPERLENSLEPFSEIFILSSSGAYIPNPKLIKVIGNNVMPAIARVIINEGLEADDLSASFIQEGVILAKNLRVFQTQIGQFNRVLDNNTLIDLSSVINRTCPAMKMFTDSLSEHLPIIYENCR